MRKIIISITILIFSVSLYLSPILAQGRVDDTDFDTETGLGTIEIPFFNQLDFGDTAGFTIISWLSFIGALLSLAIFIYWVFLLVSAGLKALRAEGDSEKIQQGFKETKSTFIGVSIALMFPILLSIIGAIVGVGAIWQWPQAFQTCDNANYDFYFQAFSDNAEETC